MMKAENSNAQRWGMGKNQTSYNNNEAYMGTDGGWYFGNEAANFGQYVYMAGHKASYASSMGTVMMGNYTVSNRYLPMAVIGGTMNGNSGELTMSTSGYSNTVQAATTSLYVVIQEGTNIPQGSTIGLFGIKDAN
jgi:hypothetical protein